MSEERQPQWYEVREWAKDRIAEHERAIRQVGLPHDETEASRVAIDVLEALLNLAKPSNIQTNDASD